MSDPKKPTYSAYRNVVYALYGITVLGLIGLTARGVIKGIYFPETSANESVENQAEVPELPVTKE